MTIFAGRYKQGDTSTTSTNKNLKRDEKIIRTGVIALAILLVGVNANAQDKPLTFGVKGGLNLANFGGDVTGTDAKIGFNVGLTADYALSEALFLQSGLELTTKGAKVEMPMDGLAVTATMNPMYLQLPVHLAYKTNINEATKIVFFAGPYLAYGIGGKIKASTLVTGVNVEASEDVFQEGNLKKFDFGVGGGVGVELGKIGVSLGYDLGLINVFDIQGDGKATTQNAYLSLGYKF